MAISMEVIEDMPHVVIVRQNGKVEVREFKTGTEAGYFSMGCLANSPNAEITVCLLVRKLGTVSEGDLMNVK